MNANQITDKIAIEKFTYFYISSNSSLEMFIYLSCPILTQFKR